MKCIGSVDHLDPPRLAIETLRRSSVSRFAYLGFALCTAVATSFAQTAYTLTDLGTLPGCTRSVATALNGSGQVVGHATDGKLGTARAFRYANNTMVSIGGDAASTWASSINASGQVAGATLAARGDRHAVLYANGSLTDLGTLGGADSFAWGINAAGQIVGEAETANFDTHPFLYASGKMTDLGTLGGSFGVARAINDAGQIVGEAETASVSLYDYGSNHAFLDSGGKMTDLGTLGGSVSWANAINGSGQVVGGSDVRSSDGQHAFLYANGRMTDLGTLPGLANSEANGINASGQVVGDGFDRDRRNQHAFLYANARLFDLNDLIVGAPGWMVLTATGINDNGTIVGSAQMPGGDVHAVLLSPSSQPLVPAIRIPPASQHAIAGTPVALTVASTGVNLSYQWKKDGVAIAGATRPDLTIASATTADMGFYSVVVSDGATSVESAHAIVTISAPMQNAYVYTTFAGSAGPEGRSDGTGSAARFNFPRGLALDFNGNVFVADSYNGLIRKITSSAVVTTLTTGFRFANSVAVDARGNVYFDEGNAIQKLTPQGVVETFAGLASERGRADGTGSAARFDNPTGVAIDLNGNLYVADRNNYTVRRITPTGVVTTLAGFAGSAGNVDGTGSAARFTDPVATAVDGSGNVYVVELMSCTIRKVTAAGVVTTLAGTAGQSGSADGAGAEARFRYPVGVAVDGSRNVFVADRGNHTLRKITATGVVTTIGGVAGAQGSVDGSAATARFNNPSGLAVDGSGTLFIADEFNNIIRKGIPPAAVAPAVSRLANISTRGFVPAGGDLTVGFVVRGSGGKSLLVRAVGPTLSALGVAGALEDPKLDIIPSGTTTVLSSNNDWGGGATLAEAFAGVGAFPLPVASKDAALLTLANVAGYSARVTSSLSGAAGIAIAEVYDRDASLTACRLVNVSALGLVGGGAQSLSPGFVIAGTEPKQLLIRVVGPGLRPFGVAGVLGDPQFTVIPLGQTFTVASNDNWDSSAAPAFAQAGAFSIAAGSNDAALVVRLPPGGYTAQITGAGNTTGAALVEVYDLDP